MHEAAHAVVHLLLRLEVTLLAVLKTLGSKPPVREHTKLPRAGGTRREGLGDGSSNFEHIKDKKNTNHESRQSAAQT